MIFAICAVDKTVSGGLTRGVKEKNLSPEPPAESLAASAQQQGDAQAEHDGCSRTALRADAILAKRCVAGEVAAWEELYAQCHDPLCLSIKLMLGRLSADQSLVDEIAARVWYALVANDGDLLARYNPKRRARLITFMRTLAKGEISNHFRAEVRRRERELVALRERPQHQGAEPEHTISVLSEFLDTLSPGERGFCNEHLLAEAADAGAVAYSSASIWQLTRRVYQKLMRFLSRSKG